MILNRKKRLGIQYKKGLIPPQSPTVKAYMKDTSPFCIASGGRNMSKTFYSLWDLFDDHDRTPGLQSCVIRKVQRSLNNTILTQLDTKLLKYPLSHNKNPWKYNKSEQVIYFDNGGRMAFGGMDNSGKILGAEYHRGFYSQIELEDRPENISNILGCMEGYRAGTHLRDREGFPYYKLTADANPGPPDHFLKLWEEEDRVKFFDFTHKDHPHYYDWSKPGLTEEGLPVPLGIKEGYTPQGVIIRQGIKRIYPPGFMRDRMLDGVWAGEEGLVYQIDPKFYTIDTLPDMTDWTHYRAIDLGRWRFVTLFVAVSPNRDQVIVYKEYRKSDTRPDVHGLRIAELTDYPITDTITDHNTWDQDDLNDVGIPTTPAPDKDIMLGVNTVHKLFSDGILKIYSNLLVQPEDPYYHRESLPRSIFAELLRYSYLPLDKRTGNPKIDDLPNAKKDDHDALDALRYLMVYLFATPDIPIISKTIRRRIR